jgi:hypothetical protein
MGLFSRILQQNAYIFTELSVLPTSFFLFYKNILAMPCGKKRKRHKISTHKRKKRLRKNRHKKKK